MKHLITEIQRLTVIEKKSLLEITLKTTEETGELAQAVLSANGSSGASYKNLTLEDVREETVDILICVLSVYFKAGGRIEDLEGLIQKKTTKWASKQQ